jgi:hypothetical protein
MKHKYCIECGGSHGHHFNGCPEAPEPDDEATVTITYDGIAVTTIEPDGNGWWAWSVEWDEVNAGSGRNLGYENAERAASELLRQKYTEETNK